MPVHEGEILRKFLRRIVNRAVREKLISVSPYLDYENPKYKDPDRVYLFIEEVDKIEEALLKPLTDMQLIVGHYFLLGCYASFRHSDWLRFNEKFIQGERIITRTKKNGKLVSFEMHDRLKKVVAFCLKHRLELSIQKTNDYIEGIANIAGIEKHITSHSGRHSFAVRCAELSISKEDCAEMMGVEVRSVGYYYKVVNRKLDKEMQKWNTPTPAPVPAAIQA